MGIMLGSGTTAEGVSGVIAHDSTITINALGGENFGTKPDPDSRGTDKPVMVWRADDGIATPNATLGWRSVWEGGASDVLGTVDTDTKATNSIQSLRADGSYAFSGGPIDVDEMTVFKTWGFLGTNKDDTYVFRRRMVDHVWTTNYAARTRTSSVVVVEGGSSIEVGQWGRSQASPNATGKIEAYNSVAEDIYWDNTEGTTAGMSGENFYDSPDNGDVDIYATEAEADSGTGTILMRITTDEGLGSPFRNYNQKNNRELQDSNNISLFVSFTGPGFNGGMQGSPSGTIFASGWDNGVSFFDPPADTWQANEFIVKEASAVDTADGYFLFATDGVMAYPSTGNLIITRSTSFSEKLTKLAQDSNDNGMKPQSYFYYDYYYVDDSYCRVIIADTSSLTVDGITNTTPYDLQVCPIVSWADQTITCVVQQGDLASFVGKYFHVVDSDNSVVSSRLIS